MSKKTIHTPVKDFSGLVAGVHFVGGKGETDSPAAIAYFERQGYEVGGKVDEDAKRDYPEGDINEKWTIAQMKAFAADRQIDLGDAKSKDEVWSAVKPGGTPYKGVTKPNGEAIVKDSTVEGSQPVSQETVPVK